MFTRLSIRGCASVLAVLLSALVQASFVGQGSAHVTFTAQGPAGFQIVGKGSELSVSEVDGKVRIVVPLAGLDTGISLRNRHMREKYLEVNKYPDAELVVERSSLQLPQPGASTKSNAQGQLTLHGRTKKVPFAYSAKNVGGKYEVTGTTQVDIRDFGIEIPSYMGVTVKPRVDVEVKFSAVDP